MQKIQPYCYSIILFGSCAEGTNEEESDIDLFVKSEYKNKVQKIIHRYKIKDIRIQAIVQDPLEIITSQEEDKEFFNQVKKGITLWEGKPIYEKI